MEKKNTRTQKPKIPEAVTIKAPLHLDKSDSKDIHKSRFEFLFF